MGQGIATSYAQLAVDVFGVPIDKIRVVQGDTDRGNGFGSAGSRSLFTGGSAVRVASERTVEHGSTLAGEALEAAPADIEYRAGRFSVVGTDLGIDLFALAGKQPEQAHPPRRRRAASAGRPGRTRCHVCEVEIDPDTGDVKVVAVRVGQRHRPRRQPDDRARPGRGRRGAGHRPGAVRSRSSTTPRAASSSPAASWTTPCRAPTAAAGFLTEFDTSIPCALNPLGVKGVGELGTIGATPAAMNAIIDALDHAGLGRSAETLAMPATPERVWRALHATSA